MLCKYCGKSVQRNNVTPKVNLWRHTEDQMLTCGKSGKGNWHYATPKGGKTDDTIKTIPHASNVH